MRSATFCYDVIRSGEISTINKLMFIREKNLNDEGNNKIGLLFYYF